MQVFKSENITCLGERQVDDLWVRADLDELSSLVNAQRYVVASLVLLTCLNVSL